MAIHKVIACEVLQWGLVHWTTESRFVTSKNWKFTFTDLQYFFRLLLIQTSPNPRFCLIKTGHHWYLIKDFGNTIHRRKFLFG